jgi:hypothetical protein
MGDYENGWDEAMAAEYPNLYALHKTVADFVPYAKYASPAVRNEFVNKPQQAQTNDLLKQNLGAITQLAAGPIIKTVSPLIGNVVSKTLPKTYNFLTQQVARKGQQLYHGGLSSDTTLKDIDLLRIGTQQGKGKYGGFYTSTQEPSSINMAKNYAIERNTPLHNINLRKDARILNTEDYIDRITPDKIKELSKSYDVLQGKSLKGGTQSVILNKDAIQSFGIVKK